MKIKYDKYGRGWKLPVRELCPTCGQPDNCGDCNHKRLRNSDVVTLDGILPKKQVGDGKLPNAYWIRGSDDYLLFNEEIKGYDWASETNKKLGKIYKKYGCFSTYEKAFEKYNELLNDEVVPIECEGIHSLTIDDRISGEIYSSGYYARMQLVSEFENHDSTEFTKKELGDNFK